VTSACPTSRWYRLREHAEQRRLWASAARFRVAACGRRSGKSELAKRQGVARAIAPQVYADARYIFGGPTWEQSKRVFWSDLKKLVPPWALIGQTPKTAISEGELSIKLMSGATIQVVGLDRPQRAEGTPIDWLCIDEAADVREDAWTFHLRPGLSERGGEAWIISTPEGRNWLWALAQKAQEDDTGLWSFHTWASSTVLPPEEIAIARTELDERTFKQEYEADFLDASGRVYYAFDRDVHVEPVAYDPALPVSLCLDFNVSPGTGIVVQEQMYRGKNPAVDRAKPVTCVIAEIWIKDNSNTVRICQEFLARYGDHKFEVCLYGDAAGGNRGTSGVLGSDWSLVQQCLEPAFGRTAIQPSRLRMRVPRSNPSVRSRINATNSRLRAVDGTVRLIVDPSCKHLIEDLEGVTWAPNGRDIDKRNPWATHLTDGLSYMIVEEHPVGEHRSSITQL